MKKIAIFVEGLTERVFVEKLLKEIFEKNIDISSFKVSGGKTKKISYLAVAKSEEEPSLTVNYLYYAQIYDCGGDTKVKSYMLDSRNSLIKSGFSKIIGLLDLYPKTMPEYDRYVRGLKYNVPTKDIKISFVISIMEIEAWFLAESSHFERIDAGLSPDMIMENLAFHPEIDDMATRPQPSTDLHNSYGLVGKAYQKSETHIHRTVEALDYCNIYLETSKKLKSLKELIDEIEEIFC